MDLFNVKFFTNIEQYKYNMAIKNKIYFYSFSLLPKQYHPSGTCNFSVLNKFNVLYNIKENDKDIDKIIYDLKLKLLKKNSKIIFCSKYYNILTIDNGLLTLKYI